MNAFCKTSIATIMLSCALGANDVSAHDSEPDNPAARAKVENGLRPEIAKPSDAPWRLTDRMAHYKVPAVSIAVIEDGEIKWAYAYGMRQVSPPIEATTDTKFQAASISKPIAAMGALALAEQGKLSLDGDFNAHLKSWKIPASDFTAKQAISLRTLLTHRAGLSTSGFDGYARTAPMPTLQQVLDGAKPANSAAVRSFASPYAQPQYSGGGFTVMQQGMLDVGSKPFAALLNTLVLQPAGMLH